MNRFAKFLLTMILLIAISGISKSFAITTEANLVQTSTTSDFSMPKAGAKECCNDTHEKHSLKTVACVHFCILTDPPSTSASPMKSARLYPLLRTEGRGLANAKLKRPPRIIL